MGWNCINIAKFLLNKEFQLASAYLVIFPQFRFDFTPISYEFLILDIMNFILLWPNSISKFLLNKVFQLFLVKLQGPKIALKIKKCIFFYFFPIKYNIFMSLRHWPRAQFPQNLSKGVVAKKCNFPKKRGKFECMNFIEKLYYILELCFIIYIVKS